MQVRVRLREAAVLYQSTVVLSVLVGGIIASVTALMQPITAGMFLWAAAVCVVTGVQAIFLIATARRLGVQFLACFHLAMGAMTAPMAALWALPVTFGT